MAVSKNVLGMNARNYLYIRKYNPPSAKRAADDKLETKKILIRDHIPTPKLLATFYTRKEIRNFDFDLPQTGFVIKPARGYGGEGIIAVKSWENNHGITVSGIKISAKQIRSHLLDILDGAYSLQYLPDKAFIEERIVLHHFFKKIAPIGIPDIRIIVFNMIPIMAMLRLPTVESSGKANLHQGGLGIGIDIRTGITTHAISKGKFITKIPGLKIKVRGIKIPDWTKLLLLASTTQSAIKLGYAGCDIVLDQRYGPVILEVNARPGLEIQNANRSSLRTRLERVEHMPVVSPARGVEVGRSLFAESFSEKVQSEKRILKVIEPIVIRHKEKTVPVQAKLDTGAYRTSIDIKLAEELGLEKQKESILIKSASGQNYRPSVKLTFLLANKKITTIATVADRSTLKYPIIVGRRDLKGFLISPSISETFDESESEFDEIEDTSEE